MALGIASSAILLGAIDCAELVAVGIAHVRQVHCPQAAFTQAWLIFVGLAAMRDRRVMEFLVLLRRVALEADGAAIGKSRPLTVDWLAHAKGASGMPLEEPGVAGTGLVEH